MNHVIAPVGMIASGKDYIADIIQRELHIPKSTVSDILREKVKAEGGDAGNRQTLIDMSNRLTQESGGDAAILACKTLEEAQARGVSRMQIVGMRQSPQMIYLMNKVERMTSLFLHTHNPIRYDRYMASKMARGEPVLSYEEFLQSEIDHNTGSNNDLYNLAKLCRYHWLPDGSVVDIGELKEIPTSLPKYDAKDFESLLSQDPDKLREWLGGEKIIEPIHELKTPEFQQELNSKIKNDPSGELARESARKTRVTTRIIIGYSIAGPEYLEGYARGKQ